MTKASHTIEITRSTYTVKAGARVYDINGKAFTVKAEMQVQGHFRYGAFYFVIRDSNEFRTEPGNVSKEAAE